MSDATTTLLWTIGRGSGAAAFLLLSASMLLGLLTWSRWTRERFPRFLTTGIHRNVSLLGLGFVLLHLVTLVLDHYAKLNLLDTLVPFAAGYRPFWVGLGTIAFDLLLVVTATSLAQKRLGWRRWRAVHWAAYACWPAAALHAVGSGTDNASAWLLGGLAVSTALLVPAVLARIARARSAPARRRAGLAAGALAATAAGAVAVASTDLVPRADALRAATATVPAAAAAAAAPAPIARFALPLHARLTSDVHRDGSAQAMIDGTLGSDDAAGGARLRAVISGVLQGDALVPETIRVAYAAADGGAAWSGTGRMLEADAIVADVRRGEDELRLVIHLAVDASTGEIGGTVDGGPATGDGGGIPADDDAGEAA